MGIYKTFNKIGVCTSLLIYQYIDEGNLNLINLLFIIADTQNTLDKNFYFLELELYKITNLTTWRESNNIHNILKQIPELPDFILVANDLQNQMYPIISGLSSINIPTGLIVSDVHRFTELRRQYIKKNNISCIFSITHDKFNSVYPEYKNKMIHFPHFINPDLYRDYGLKKEIELLMMGATSNTYPLREKILEFYKTDPNFVYHEHPGYKNIKKDREALFYTDKKYAREINRAKIFFTCPSVFNYPVMKYYEALACKSLLLAPTFKELENLGFIPNTHFIPINEYNFKEKADYFLKNQQEREKITKAGYQFIHQNHTLQIRAHQLIKEISEKISL